MRMKFWKSLIIPVSLLFFSGFAFSCPKNIEQAFHNSHFAITKKFDNSLKFESKYPFDSVSSKEDFLSFLTQIMHSLGCKNADFSDLESFYGLNLTEIQTFGTYLKGFPRYLKDPMLRISFTSSFVMIEKIEYIPGDFAPKGKPYREASTLSTGNSFGDAVKELISRPQ